MKTYVFKLEDFPGNLNPELEIDVLDNGRLKYSFMSKRVLSGDCHCYYFQPTDEHKAIYKKYIDNPAQIAHFLRQLGFKVKKVENYW